MLVNGVEQPSAILKDGDVLAIGPYKIEVSVSPEEVIVPTEKAAEPPPSNEGAPELEDPSEFLNESGEDKGAAVSEPADLDKTRPTDPNALAQELDLNAGGDAANGENVLGQLDAPSEGVVEGGNPADPLGLESAEAGNNLSPEPLNPEGAEGGALGASPGSDSTNETPDPAKFFEAIGENDPTKISAGNKLTVKLIFTPGDANVEEFTFPAEGSGKDEVSIGRGQNCDIILNDKKASRKNTTIRRLGINFVIKDLDSANGTFVNSTGIKEQSLSSGDKIQIGNTEFEFRATSVEYSKQEKNLLSLPTESNNEVAEVQVNLPAGNPLDNANNGVSAMMMENSDLPPGAPPQAYGLDNQNAGIVGINGGGKKKGGSLMERFRAQPPRTQVIIAVLVLLVGSWLMEDDKKTAQAGSKAQSKCKCSA